MQEHDSRSDAHLKPGSDRGFGFVFTAFWTVFAILPLRHGGPLRVWSLALAAVFLLVSLVAPAALHRLNILWFQLGLLLGRVVNPIVISLVYCVVVAPLGLLVRALGKDLLRLKARDDSYWITRTPPGPEPDTMKVQF